MTDLVGADRGGKRERLVASAADLMHRQGVPVTTLAQVAQAADVPPGNVYYYFKTKDDLVRAVIQARTEQIHGLISAADKRRTPAAALKALLRSWRTCARSWPATAARSARSARTWIAVATTSRPKPAGCCDYCWTGRPRSSG